MNELDKLNDTKLVKTILNILLKVESKKWSHYNNEYEDQSVQYVLPDYDHSFNNSAYFVDTKSGLNETDLTNRTILSQLSTSILYVVFMLLLYALIILVVFVSAIYSHRKRTGYTYDDSVYQMDESDSSNCDESSDELPTDSIKYSKLVNVNDDDQFKQVKQTKAEIIDETSKQSRCKRFKQFHMKRIKEHFRLRFARCKYMHKDRKQMFKYLSIRNSLKPINYLKNIINNKKNRNFLTNASFSNTNNEYVNIQNMSELNQRQSSFREFTTSDNFKKSNQLIDSFNENLLSEYKL